MKVLIAEIVLITIGCILEFCEAPGIVDSSKLLPEGCLGVSFQAYLVTPRTDGN